jgi:DeoR/GlpR family transcriptional regulator of sugar metabolism
MTIWRDLKQLEEQGYIRRVHGGVISMQTAALQIEGVYSKRARENTREKIAIAKAALPLIHPGHAVYLDAGSTLMSVANHINNDRYTIITSGANIAIELSQRHTCDVLLTGGQISENTLSCSGAQAEAISSINIDLALMSPSASPSHGFTSGSRAKVCSKRAVISKAAKVVMLMDIPRSALAAFYVCESIGYRSFICNAPLPRNFGGVKAQTSIVLSQKTK